MKTALEAAAQSAWLASQACLFPHRWGKALDGFMLSRLRLAAAGTEIESLSRMARHSLAIVEPPCDVLPPCDTEGTA